MKHTRIAKPFAVAAMLVFGVAAGCSKTSQTSPPTEQPSTAAQQSTIAQPSTAGQQPTAAHVSAEAQKIGKNVGDLLTRVSDGVAYEIYPGIFRGAAGTLADGAGNDFDKALLLRDLIRASDPSANLRFASCVLSSQQIDAIASAARSAYRPRLLDVLTPSSISKIADPRLRLLIQRVSDAWNEILAQDRFESDSLRRAMQVAGISLNAPSVSDADAIAANHVWLQEQTGGQWTDLDPTLPHARAGDTMCAAQSVMQTIPDADYDTITVRVRAEQRENAAITDRTVVQGVWRAEQLAGNSLTFAFAEVAGFSIPRSSGSTPAGMVAYTPVLRAGDTMVAGQPLYVPRLSSKSIGSVVNGHVSQVIDAFGTPQPTSAPQVSTPAYPEPVGVWIEVSVNVVGRKPETVESEVFDRVAFADRAANHLTTTQLARLDDGHGQYLPFSGVWNIAVNEGGAVVGVGDTTSIVAHSDDAENLVHALGLSQRAFYAVRRSVFATVGGPQAPEVRDVQPGVSVLGVMWQSGTGQPPTFVPTMVMDVRSDHAFPSTTDSTWVVSWAVASLLAERFVTHARSMLNVANAGGDLAQVPASDVLAVLDAARKASIPNAIVRSAGDIGPLVSADARARLTDSIGDGSIALGPASAVNVYGASDLGWWIIGQDGSMHDEMQNGRHDEAEEYPAVAKIDAETEAPAFNRSAMKVKCAALAVAAFMAVASHSAPPEEAAEQLDQASELISAVKDANEIEEKIKQAEEAGESC